VQNLSIRCTLVPFFLPRFTHPHLPNFSIPKFRGFPFMTGVYSVYTRKEGEKMDHFKAIVMKFIMIAVVVGVIVSGIFHTDFGPR
jgi:hypothetical protein